MHHTRMADCVDISDQSASAAAQAAWDASIAKVREGTRLYLTNDFARAEEIFKQGMGQSVGGSAALKGEQNDEEEEADAIHANADDLSARDVRGAFALQFAIVGLMRGVASLANDQLDECLARLWEADRLAALDAPWVGKKVVRGVCTLCAGVVQCLQHNLVKGVFNILRSWQWIRYLRSEALEFDGVGASVVRSAAQLALGMFALILSLLPPHMIRAASWSTGFEIDREAGLALLRQCQSEDGIYAPIACLTVLSFELDTKVFLGEAQTDDSLAECAKLIDWAGTRFEDSVFFSIFAAELHACRHDLNGARRIVEGIGRLPCVGELRALSAVVAYKSAVYHLAQLEWHDAALAFAASLEVYRAANRRSLSPAMAVLSALSHLAAGERDEGEAMMAIVASYRALNKSNWQRQDRMAFRLLARYRGDPQEEASVTASGAGGVASGALAAATAATSTATATATAAAATVASAAFSLSSRLGLTSARDASAAAPPEQTVASKIVSMPPAPPADTRQWALLQLAQTMTITMRCTWWMSDEQCAEFVALLRGLPLESSDDRAQRCMVLAQLRTHRQRPSEGLAEANAGLALESELGAAATSWGYVPMLHCLSAQLHAKLGEPHRADASLRAISRYRTGSYTCSQMVTFKTTQLRRSLGLLQAESAYEQLSIAAGRIAALAVRLQRTGGNEAAEAAEWDWALSDGKDVEFGVSFAPDGGGAVEPLVPERRWLASEGPCEGKFNLPDGCNGGTLTLMWSNYASYLRSKDVSYRLLLPGSERQVPKAVLS